MNAADRKNLRELGDAIYAALDLPFTVYPHSNRRADLALARMAAVRGCVAGLAAIPLSVAIENLRSIPADLPVDYPVAGAAAFLDAQ